MSNQSKYLCPICGADNMCTDFTDGFKWGRAYCNSCDCAGPEVRTGYEESLDAPWRTEARKQFADVANEYANKPLADDTNVARSPWVKTADRLPDDNKPVLVTYVGYTDNLPYADAIAVYAHEMADNYAGAWYWQDSDGVDDNPVSVSITHWMPIPPLPEVGE